ncbi:MAG: hypothetical protein ACT4NY_09070 [Pseudonocardiales bacterium]
MVERYGIEQTSEMFSALVNLALAAKQAGADGWKITADGALLITDSMLTNTVATALRGAEQIGYELADLSLSEGLQLVMAVIPALGRFAYRN